MKTQFPRVDWLDSKEEKRGNLLSVGYLSQDEGPGNPQEEWEGEGIFYLSRDVYSMWHEPVVVRNYLCCSSGEFADTEPDIDHGFDPGTGTLTTLREIAAEAFYAAMDWDRVKEWVEFADTELEEGDTYETVRGALKDQIFEGFVNNGPFSEDVEQKAIDLYPRYWQRMVGPYVVPICYNSERGSTRISVTNWDGDPDNLPDGIWVACKCAEMNIGANGSPEEIRARAVRYAEGVCQTMEDWCNGNVYGVCYEAYELDEDGEPGEMVAEDVSWDHFGDEYAQQAMREGFDDFVKRTLDDLKLQAEKKTFPPNEIGI